MGRGIKLLSDYVESRLVSPRGPAGTDRLALTGCSATANANAAQWSADLGIGGGAAINR
jgi:hypothetical protein